MGMAGRIFLGTVALEPNRWSTLDPSGAPRTDLAEWLPAVADAGFDGLELWDRHLPDDPVGAAAIIDGPVPIAIFNSYVGFDDPDPADRSAEARRIAATGASAVKFNVGNEPPLFDAYVERVRDWVDALSSDVLALCECHAGISIAEDPDTAASLFAAVDRPGRIGAIVHTHESTGHLQKRFDAYGSLIAHVHVNYLDPATFTAPPLAERIDDLSEKVALLHGLGFEGTWTIEFVEGVLTERDEPGHLLRQAVDDLAVLRSCLGSTS